MERYCWLRKLRMIAQQHRRRRPVHVFIVRRVPIHGRLSNLKHPNHIQQGSKLMIY